jgi:cytoskeleton protein RodZ
MSEVETVDEIISLENIGFGNTLRNAREKKGLSLADVGIELHLDESIIYAIENHNLEQLPEPAYICGYIRNYARLMQIDAEPLLESFKQDISLKSNLSSVNTIGRTLDKKHDKRTVLFLLFLIMLLTVGGFLGWQFWENKKFTLFSNEKAIVTNNSSITLNQDVTDSIEDDNRRFVSSPDNKLELSKAELETESGTIDLPKNKQIPQQVIENTKIAETSDTPENIKTNTATPELSQEEENVIKTEQPAEITTATDIISDVKAIASRKQLEFKFNKNSWISVKDGSSKSLIYDLVHKGELLTFSGKPPMAIFLGDGTGVELIVDGKAFNFTQFINTKNIAKFVVE